MPSSLIYNNQHYSKKKRNVKMMTTAMVVVMMMTKDACQVSSSREDVAVIFSSHLYVCVHFFVSTYIKLLPCSFKLPHNCATQSLQLQQSARNIYWKKQFSLLSGQRRFLLLLLPFASFFVK